MSEDPKHGSVEANEGVEEVGWSPFLTVLGLLYAVVVPIIFYAVPPSSPWSSVTYIALVVIFLALVVFRLLLFRSRSWRHASGALVRDETDQAQHR
jgi:membrane protein YdbS with pleckstrin-like domain